MNPTSENIARYIYEKISEKRPELRLEEVTVWETDTSSATYTKR
ncbi:MAG: 6-pyruvoyl tetrahydropterin synthase family protein [Candidatus Omnitrophota bacterium]